MRLRSLVEELNALSARIIFPLHPRTRAALDREGLVLSSNISVISPVGYLEMTALISRARLILTDSGGLQKEAYWARVPCLTLRCETEWVETVNCGANHVLGTECEDLVPSIEKALSTTPEWKSLYGDGYAAERIAATLQSFPG